MFLFKLLQTSSIRIHDRPVLLVRLIAFLLENGINQRIIQCSSTCRKLRRNFTLCEIYIYIYIYVQVLEKVLDLLWSRIVSRSQLNFASDESVPYNPYNELGSSSLRLHARTIEDRGRSGDNTVRSARNYSYLS